MNIFLIIMTFILAWLVGKAMGQAWDYTDKINKIND